MPVITVCKYRVILKLYCTTTFLKKIKMHRLQLYHTSVMQTEEENFFYIHVTCM